MYHQPLHSLCTYNANTVSLNSYDLSISYVEEHDENTVEFPHSHPKEYEIYYVMEGPVEHMVQDRVYRMQQGEFLFLKQGVLHQTLYKPDQKKRYLAVVFSLQKRAAPCYYNGLDEFEAAHMESFFQAIQEVTHIYGKDAYGCDAYVQDMIQEAEVKDWGWFYKLQFLYSNFILGIIRNFVPPINTAPKRSNKNLPIGFTKYLHANYQNPNLSIQDVADQFFLSPRHANRLFKEFFGASLSKTLTQYRIAYAKNYLMDTDFSIEKIAEEVGLGSASTLSRLFKEAEGITISEYRYRCKQQKLLSHSMTEKDQ